MAPRDAVTAVRRFGLGGRPGDLKQIAGDPRGFVLASLQSPGGARLARTDLPGTQTIYGNVRAANERRRDARNASPLAALGIGSGAAQAPAPARKPTAGGGEATMSDAAPATGGDRVISPGEMLHRAYMADATARIEHALATPAGFLERLAMFWSGHFCVGGGKGRIVGIVGAYEREAIRPHVLGRFVDMLMAVEQHPAMLMYLDNTASIGPNSGVGARVQKGLNENLAREILELHTLGVDGGYSQADVTNLARLITGWSVTDSTFQFVPAWHEPGTWTVLGKAYASGGVEAGRKCLADIARHPSTARFIARKLASHFVGDSPPPSLLARLEATFRQTDGDLAALARALVTAPEAWDAPQRKSVPPYDFAISLARGFNIAMPAADVLRLASTLGQPLWKPSSPKGFPDGDDAWISPPAMRERLRMAEAATRDIDKKLDPRQAAEALLGPTLSAQTRQAIARAETREQGLELMIMSPEFLRR